MPSSAYWKLRRIAPRAIRIVERRRTSAPVIEAYATTLPAKAQSFMDAYDAAGKFVTAWRKEMGEGKGSINAVLATMRSWLPLAQRDIPGFDSRNFGDKPRVPDDVIEDGGRLYDMVHDYRDGADQPLPYQTALLEKLETDLANATKEWGEAEASDKQYQTLLATMRQTAQAFDEDLKPFRRSLAVVVGRSDKDYQKLRAQKAHSPDEDDDAAAPAAPAAVIPAEPGVTEPAKS